MLLEWVVFWNPLRKNFGNSIKRFDVTLVRRWADLEQIDETST